MDIAKAEAAISQKRQEIEARQWQLHAIRETEDELRKRREMLEMQIRNAREVISDLHAKAFDELAKKDQQA